VFAELYRDQIQAEAGDAVEESEYSEEYYLKRKMRTRRGSGGLEHLQTDWPADRSGITEERQPKSELRVDRLCNYYAFCIRGNALHVLAPLIPRSSWPVALPPEHTLRCDRFQSIVEQARHRSRRQRRIAPQQPKLPLERTALRAGCSRLKRSAFCHTIIGSVIPVTRLAASACDIPFSQVCCKGQEK